jgi:hypothetical protein
MKVWDELSEEMREKTKHLGTWAQKQAKELSAAGIRTMERQELTLERKRLVRNLGDQVVQRMLKEEKKTIHRDSPEISDILDQIASIDLRLAQKAD